eukprot:scaffold931_cov383-Prasinococcus_capsulatus_cf.AAC.12
MWGHAPLGAAPRLASRLASLAGPPRGVRTELLPHRRMLLRRGWARGSAGVAPPALLRGRAQPRLASPRAVRTLPRSAARAVRPWGCCSLLAACARARHWSRREARSFQRPAPKESVREAARESVRSWQRAAVQRTAADFAPGPAYRNTRGASRHARRRQGGHHGYHGCTRIFEHNTSCGMFKFEVTVSKRNDTSRSTPRKRARRTCQWATSPLLQRALSSRVAAPKVGACPTSLRSHLGATLPGLANGLGADLCRMRHHVAP